jgi:hypothetical protein
MKSPLFLLGLRLRQHQINPHKHFIYRNNSTTTRDITRPSKQRPAPLFIALKQLSKRFPLPASRLARSVHTNNP